MANYNMLLCLPRRNPLAPSVGSAWRRRMSLGAANSTRPPRSCTRVAKRGVTTRWPDLLQVQRVVGMVSRNGH